MKREDFTLDGILLLEKYRDYINLWAAEQHDDFVLPLDAFFEYNSSQEHPASIHRHIKVIHVEADYGDEGGPAELIGTWYRMYEEDDWEFKSIYMIFDTMGGEIYGETWINSRQEYGWYDNTNRKLKWKEVGNTVEVVG